MFGLKFPDSKPNEFCNKKTLLLTNAPLQSLACKCCGKHVHVHAIGGFKHHCKWLTRSAWAGQYPVALSNAWAQAVDDYLNDYAAPY